MSRVSGNDSFLDNYYRYECTGLHVLLLMIYVRSMKGRTDIYYSAGEPGNEMEMKMEMGTKTETEIEDRDGDGDRKRVKLRYMYIRKSSFAGAV